MVLLLVWSLNFQKFPENCGAIVDSGASGILDFKELLGYSFAKGHLYHADKEEETLHR